jgi:ABC-type Fe2+-enterobactin transport system substrate-binding protein
MPALALADALKDFGHIVQPRIVDRAPTQREQPKHESIVTQAPDPEAIKAAVDEAEAALTARLAAEHAARIVELEERHRQDIAKAHAEIGEKTGTELAGQMAQLETRIIEITSSVTARILGIAMTEDVQRAALTALAESISAAVNDREAVRIRIRGPLSLFEALQPGLGKYADHVDFTETAGFDLTASIDDTLLETRLSEWSAALAEIMA